MMVDYGTSRHLMTVAQSHHFRMDQVTISHLTSVTLLMLQGEIAIGLVRVSYSYRGPSAGICIKCGVLWEPCISSLGAGTNQATAITPYILPVVSVL